MWSINLLLIILAAIQIPNTTAVDIICANNQCTPLLQNDLISEGNCTPNQCTSGETSRILASVAEVLARISNDLANGGNILIEGKSYYIKSSNGKFAVLDKFKKLAFMKDIPMAKASKFVAVKESFNVFGLCVDGSCMSRCAACKNDIGDLHSVKFHLNDSSEPYSQWKIETVTDSDGVPSMYNLKIDGAYGYLTAKKIFKDKYQLSLARESSNESKFYLIQAM